MKSLCFAVFALLAFSGSDALAQGPSDRVWLAGRYDRDHVIVYFDAVKFKGTLRHDRKLAYPQAYGFFDPVEVTPEFSSRFQRGARVERFSIGDRYEILFGAGRVATVTLTKLVGVETDEDVGNDSYIGAIGLVADSSFAQASQQFYALRRKSGVSRQAPGRVSRVWLDTTPPSHDVALAIAARLQQNLDSDTTTRSRRDSRTIPVALQHVETFTLANGEQRRFIKARFATAEVCGVYAFSDASSPPTLSPHGTYFCLNQAGGPRLLSVVDLGSGRTGLIFEIEWGAGRETRLVEYRDGVGLDRLRVLQSVSLGE